MATWTVDAVLSELEREAAHLPVDVQKVRLDNADLVIEFTDRSRPGCRFAFRYPALPGRDRQAQETPDMYATEARVNLEEIIEAEGYGLPTECDPESVFWVSFDSCRDVSGTDQSDSP